MEKKKEDDVSKPETKRNDPKQRRPQTTAQAQSTSLGAKQMGEKSTKERPEKKPPKEKERTDGKGNTNETKKPPKRFDEEIDAKLAGAQPIKPPKKPEAAEKDANIITKRPRKEINESTMEKPTPVRTDGGKPESRDQSGVERADERKPKKRKQIKKDVDQGRVQQEPTVEATSTNGKAKEDEPEGLVPSDSVYRDTTEQDESDTKQVPLKYSPETLTGITELPPRKLFMMLVLCLPRFFTPWMSDWHEYNVFILVNPDLLEQHAESLFKHDMILLAVKVSAGIVCAVLADLANMRYYVYLTLLFLLLFCPVSGGVVDMVLRSRTYDQSYYKNWIWCIIMMRWAMAIPFILTPVQLACVFLVKNDMSRKAHYNWTGIFAFLEFGNAYASFWLIPAKCPTKDWIQIAVWVGIGMLMFVVIFFTIIVILNIKETRATFATCLKICGKHVDESAEIPTTRQTDNTSKGKACMKLAMFILMLAPLVYMSFVFSTIDRFLPDDDWDRHKSLSATSMFVLGKLIGVVAMVLTMFVIRKLGKLSRLGKLGKWIQKIARFKYFSMDVMVLGLPHLLNILSLFVLIGRFETLTNGYAIKEGHELYGPIPDCGKTVVLFFNLMLSNRTVCVGSDNFQSVKIRPFRFAAVEVYDTDVDRINVTVTPEPGSTPVVATSFTMTNLTKGKWIAYTISIFNDVRTYVKHNTGPKNYYAKPRVVRLLDQLVNLKIRPNNFPLLILPNNYNDVEGEYKYWFKYEGVGRLYSLTMNKKSEPNAVFLPKNPYIWQFVGCCNFSISISDPNSSRPDDNIPWYTFRVNSINRWPIYYLVSYLHTPIDPQKKYSARELPVWFKLFLVAETARWDNQAHLPDKAELQQDWALKLALTLAGMAAGGAYVGVIYVFWTDLPFPKFPATTMAVFWAFCAGAAEPARLKLIDIDPPTETVVMTLPLKLLTAQIPFTILHFAAAVFFYHGKLNFRERPD